MSRVGQLIVALFIGVLALGAFDSEAYAQQAGGDIGDAPSLEGTSFGAFGGYQFDADVFGEFIEEPFVGADLRVTFDMPDVAPGFALAANPAFNFFFVSDGTFMQIDGNALAKFGLDNGVVLHGGLGPVLTFMSNGDSETELQFNVLVAGASFPIDDDVSGFGQFRITRHSFSDEGFSFSFNAMSIMGGISFDVD